MEGEVTSLTTSGETTVDERKIGQFGPYSVYEGPSAPDELPSGRIVDEQSGQVVKWGQEQPHRHWRNALALWGVPVFTIEVGDTIICYAGDVHEAVNIAIRAYADDTEVGPFAICAEQDILASVVPIKNGAVAVYEDGRTEKYTQLRPVNVGGEVVAVVAICRGNIVQI